MGSGGKGKFRYQGGKGKGKGYGYHQKGSPHGYRSTPYEASPLSSLGSFCQTAIEKALCRTNETVVSEGLQSVTDRMLSSSSAGNQVTYQASASDEPKASSSITRAVLGVFLGSGDKSGPPQPKANVCPSGPQKHDASETSCPTESSQLVREMLEQHNQTLNILASMVTPAAGANNPVADVDTASVTQLTALQLQMQELQSEFAAAKMQLAESKPNPSTPAATPRTDGVPKASAKGPLRQTTLSFLPSQGARGAN